MRRYTVSVDDRTFVIDVEETAADRFEVTVDGQTFEALLTAEEGLPGTDITPGMPSLDERRGATATAAQPTAQVTAPARVTAPGLVAASRTVSSSTHLPEASMRAGDAATAVRALDAPMPGVVLEVLVRAGAVVRRGDPLLVLEAMKMRNTIRAPRDATVVEVAVEAGQPVGAGDLLARLGDRPG